MKIGSNIRVLERTQGFTFIWPSDLFDPIWPIIELGLHFVIMKLLTKFDEDWIKTMASRAYTSIVDAARRTPHNTGRRIDPHHNTSPGALRAQVS